MPTQKITAKNDDAAVNLDVTLDETSGSTVLGPGETQDYTIPTTGMVKRNFKAEDPTVAVSMDVTNDDATLSVLVNLHPVHGSGTPTTLGPGATQTFAIPADWVLSVHHA